MTLSIHSLIDELLLDAYDLETVDLRDTRKQEQLDKFEGFVVLEHLHLLTNEIEQQRISVPTNDWSKQEKR